MSGARLAGAGDLTGLIALFAASEVSPVAANPEPAWQAMLAHQGLATFVAESEDVIVATASLVTAPNLLREGRAHGFLENVVTHPGQRGKGYGQSVVRAALERAWELGCHHVLMQSGRADPRVHAFYEALGFQPGLRTAYVALRPAD